MRKHLLIILVLIGLSSASLAQSAKSSVDFSTYSGQSDREITLYPNPATSYFQVKVSSNAKVSNVSVFSIIGNVVLSNKVDGKLSDVRFNVGNLKKGKYMVKVTFSDGTTEVTSLFKQ